MESYVGNKFGKEEVDQVERLERMADPKDKEQAELVEKMKAQVGFVSPRE